jgi:hypothetical protein
MPLPPSTSGSTSRPEIFKGFRGFTGRHPSNPPYIGSAGANGD